jgi:transposase InsO family protein
MTITLKEAGFDVGERRVGRLMRINAIKPVRTSKLKVTTNSNHWFGIAPYLLEDDFAAGAPSRKWVGGSEAKWRRSRRTHQLCVDA